MKNASKLLLLFLLLLSKQVLSNKIDDLKTDQEVTEFVKTMNPQFAKDKYGRFAIKATDSIARDLNCNGIFKSWNIKNWEKADITNDGLTDLLFVAYWYDYISYAFIDMGNNNFRLIRFSKNTFEPCELIKPIKIGSENYLKIFRKTAVPDTLNKEQLRYKDLMITDTLVFKFDSFTELSQLKNQGNEIESIELKTDYCFGSCPVFELTLYKNGKANFIGKDYMQLKGKSSKRLPRKYFEDVTDLATYIDVRNLKNNYAVTWTDDQTATLTVVFKDKSQKVIVDYGMQGTFGLNAIYGKLMKIALQWK